jgi:flagellar biosynthetic protein FlhB
MALLDENSDARTERPTDRRRRQAREQGQVAHSAELLTAARLVATWIALAWWFVNFAATCGATLRATLESAGSSPLQPSTALALFRDLAWQLLASASWPLITVTAAVLVSHFAQIGWLWRWENVTPQPSRFLPMTGLQRLLSLRTIGRSLKLTLKLSLASATIAMAVSSHVGLMTTSLSSGLNEQLSSFGVASVSLVARVAMAVLTFAALDYVWQRWRLERSLQMTREEVREEFKESEGPPRLKTHRQVITPPRDTPSIAQPPETKPLA